MIQRWVNKVPADKRKYITLTIPQKLEIIRRLTNGNSQKEVLASYNTSSSTSYDIKKWKIQFILFMASGESLKDISKQQSLKEPKLAQMHKVCKSCIAMHSEENPVIGPMIVEKAKLFYDKMKITNKFTFAESRNKKTTIRTWVSIGTV
jgi:hypothetical protein